MSGKRLLRFFLSLLLCALTSACVSRPDLARLYESAGDDPDQPPVIVIHGLAGSTLVDAKTGKQFWPGSLSTLAFSNYRDLAQMSTEDREGEGLVPGDFVQSFAGVDFYGDLLHSLETVGHFHRGVPGQAVGNDRRRYYVLLYDWRKDNIFAVRKLHALIEQIRRDYQDPKLRVDIIAHSNGGTIANYYYRYGPEDVLEQAHFTPWLEGDQRLRRVIMLGTPNLGAVTSLERLIYGTRLALRTVPVEVMVTFATPFEALPHPLVKSVLDTQGRPVDLNIYDDQVWRREHWGVFSPEVMDRVRASMATPAEGDRALAELQATFTRNLHRAERLQWALTAPLPPHKLEVAVFGGDCELTPGHAVMLDENGGHRLVFRPGQAKSGQGADGGAKHGRKDYAHLMFEPGDGLVTRASQVAREPDGHDRTLADFQILPISQSFFLCESHGRLTHNLYFQNNLLNFLLSR
jgi:pimeloyl-ACP methyl ester carboxylesterase